MQRIVTLTDRKKAEAARRAEAVAALVQALRAFARDHRGRFLLFGSAARGAMTYHSDVDILLDFPEETLDEAWNLAETACWDRGLKPDVMSYRGCKQPFLDHIAPDLKVIP